MTCKHEFVFIAICSGHEGSTIISKCRWCGVTQQRIQTQKILGIYKEPITNNMEGNM
jgi:hypothetical protein